MRHYTTVVIPVIYFLVAVQSAVSSGLSPAPSQAFTEAVEKAKTIAEKILRDIPSAYTATVDIEGLSLEQTDTNLQLMMSSLGIPVAPVLKPPSERFTMDMCVSRISAGGHLFSDLLGVLSEKKKKKKEEEEKKEEKKEEELTELHSDIRDLLTHVTKMQTAAGLSLPLTVSQPISELSSRLHGDYEATLATHLTLTMLKAFCVDLIRSLRAVASYTHLHPLPL